VLAETYTYYYTINENTLIINLTDVKINIFPNPAKTEIQITGLKEQSGFALFDLSGKSLIRKIYRITT